ncbi:MAG: hypothetical protein KF791_14085 [Verrucomicrobiae bacterium]|nr:hypothetical protein [Verrucomicrobiae bacterium]
MNILGIAAITLIAGGALLSPFVLFWSVYCLARSSRRMEGVFILAVGLIVAGVLVLVGALTAPTDSPGHFRFQALVIVAGFFSFGAVAGKALHLIASRWRWFAR